MGTIIETKIDRFDGGIENDSRDPRENTCRVVSNFNIITDPRKMSPYRDSEEGDDSSSTSRKRNFAIAIRTGTTYSIYGLGVQSGADDAEIEFKNITIDTDANDLDDSAWGTTSNNIQTSGTDTNFNLFVYYPRTDRIYGARDGTNIWAYDPDGSSAFGNSERAITYTDIAQGLVHSKDDILYVPYDNKIAKNDNGSWTDAALTLPTHFVITSISEFGNFLAIAAAPLSGLGNSRVFLWDRDSTLTTLTESIDWGEGVIRIIEEIDGVLIGIATSGGISADNLPLLTGIRFNDRIFFRRLLGNRAVKFKEIIGGPSTTLLPIAKQKIDNKLFFMMRATINGAVREGVWSIGRTSSEVPWTLVHERTPQNDTALSSSFALYNFLIVGDFMFQAFQSGSAFEITKTNEDVSHTATSIYESKIFDGSFHGFDSSHRKDLKEVNVLTEFLPTAGQVVLAYRVNENTSYTTIFTEDTNDSISHTAINIESSGAALPKDYKEIQFRIESTGNAEITGLIFKEEVTGKRLF